MRSERLHEGGPGYRPGRGTGLIFDLRASRLGRVLIKRPWCPRNRLRYILVQPLVLFPREPLLHFIAEFVQSKAFSINLGQFLNLPVQEAGVALHRGELRRQDENEAVGLSSSRHRLRTTATTFSARELGRGRPVRRRVPGAVALNGIDARAGHQMPSMATGEFVARDTPSA